MEIFGDTSSSAAERTVVGLGYVGAKTWLVTVSPPLKPHEEAYFRERNIIKPSQQVVNTAGPPGLSHVCLGTNFGRPAAVEQTINATADRIAYELRTMRHDPVDFNQEPQELLPEVISGLQPYSSKVER